MGQVDDKFIKHLKTVEDIHCQCNSLLNEERRQRMHEIDALRQAVCERVGADVEAHKFAAVQKQLDEAMSTLDVKQQKTQTLLDSVRSDLAGFMQERASQGRGFEGQMDKRISQLEEVHGLLS